MPPVIIIRHRKENLRKCSLRGLESRSDLRFLRYPLEQALTWTPDRVLLDFSGPQLSPADVNSTLILVDGTWDYASRIVRNLPGLSSLPRRSLPTGLRTAYPRVQTHCSEPDRGLASVEALYAAFCLVGRDPSGILDHYYWAEQFLEKNRDLLKPAS